MAKYFHVMHGLRGCYMPDGEPYVAMVKTRRELKDLIRNECDMLATEFTQGFSKKAIAAFAATCWHEAQKPKLGLKPAYLPHCLPCRERGQSSYSYGIFVSVADRREYLKSEKENSD